MQKFLLEDFVVARWVHLAQFFKDCTGSVATDVALPYEEVWLEVILADYSWVIEGDVDTSKDQIFGKLCIGSIGGRDEHSRL